MSKKFKSRVCIYCGQEPSTTSGDHVFAREFFLLEDRDNLPKVPACYKCNQKKSELEHYLVTLFPFGGRHSTAQLNLETMVPKRLINNVRLSGFLSRNIENIWYKDGQVYLPTIAFPFDSICLEEWIAFVVKGVSWFHWETFLNKDTFIDVSILTKFGESHFENLLSLKSNNSIIKDLGRGTFEYEGKQGIDCPQISVWLFTIFGGIEFCGDANHPHVMSSKIGVLTGPRKVKRNVELRLKFGDLGRGIFIPANLNALKRNP